MVLHLTSAEGAQGSLQ